MSTEWLPLKTILFDDLLNRLPIGNLIFYQSISDNCKVLYFTNPEENAKSYIWIYRTEIGGTEFCQYGLNQRHYDIIEHIGKSFDTKLMSYIGEPFNDPELESIEYTHGLWKREYPKQHKEMTDYNKQVSEKRKKEWEEQNKTGSE